MTHSILNRFRRYSLVFALLLVVLSATTNAQTVTNRSTDGPTPSGVSPGAAAGTYALSGFDNINFATGSLNFRLPLRTIGGRGTAQYTMMLPIERHWSVKGQGHYFSCGGSQICFQWDFYYPDWTIGDKRMPGYGPGVMQGQQTGIRGTPCPNSSQGFSTTLTLLTFTSPDGTETEFRDQANNGQPLPASPCDNNPDEASRGTVFTSVDGSAMTFISDTPILDYWSYRRTSPSGYMYTRDGRRYRISNGQVRWIRDRNGNQLSFTYDSDQPYGRVISITDSLKRIVTVSYASPSQPYDQISFSGAGGAARTIRVGSDGTPWLRSDYQPLTWALAFPELNGTSQMTGGPGPSGPGYVELPDGRRYRFYYNSYGELARVELPTGGAYEYDWASGSGTGSGAGTDGNGGGNVYRRVVTRRVYENGGSGSGYTGKMTIARAVGTAVATVKAYAPGEVLRARTDHYFYGQPYLTSGPTTYPAWNSNREYETHYFSEGEVLLRKVSFTWLPRVTYPWAAADPRLTQRVTTLADTNQVTKQTFGYDDSVPYNNQNNVKEFDFGNGTPGPLLRETRTTYVTSASYTGTSVHLRRLPTQVSVYDGVAERARTSFEYDNYFTDPNHAALTPRWNISGLCTVVTSPTVCDNSNPPAYVTRGNVTATTRYLLTNGSVTSSIPTYAQYDVAGSVVKIIDGRGHFTTVDYSDRFGAPDGEAESNVSPVELSSIGQSSFAFATLVTNALGHTSYTQFDYYLGRPVDSEDVNGVVSSVYSENDLLDRPTKVIRAANQGISVKSQTAFSYDDTNRIVTSTGDLNTYNDNLLKSQTLYDKLGRTCESRQYEGGTNYIATKQEYDALGRPYRASNPYRPWQSESPVWTTTGFDMLGRVVTVTTADNAVVNTVYSGNQVLVTDQASKQRITEANALGQIKHVWEIRAPDSATGTEPISFPGHAEVTAGYRTTYEYDSLDNLGRVTQGAQQRIFMYDSLKRLIRSRNPEQDVNASLTLTDPVTGNSQWSLAYQYDNNDNLTLKTDARGVTITYVYDALNRNTTVDYSDTTPDSYRQYDLATNGKGRLNQVWQAGSTTSATYIDSYDALGRPLIQRQRYETGGVWSSSYQIQRAYNLAGGVISQTYPSGHTNNYSYDGAGRISSFTGNLGDGVTRTYATATTYSAFGGKQQEQFGTQVPLYHKLHYNIRGQMYDVRLSTVPWATDQWNWNRGCVALYFSYAHQQSGPLNNGNLSMMQHFVPTNDQLTIYNFTEQRYVYDQLNRLTSVAEYPGTQGGLGAVSFTQIFDYDRWGNRTINPATTNGMPETQFTVLSNNRLGVPVGQTGRMDYDAAGNLVNDTYTSYGRADGTPTRLYDAENRLTTAKDSNLQVVSSYSYNGDGQRTRRNVSGVETWQVYGMDGELLGEYASGAATFVSKKEYGYRNGQLLMTVTSGDDQRLKRFVQNLYYGALQRDPTSQELTNKTNELITAGAQSQAQLLVKAKEIARALFVQTTYETNPLRSDTQYVTDLYYTYLQRGPDAGGLGWWVPQAAGSVQNRINVLNAFEASGEFETLVNTLYGTATSDGQRTENLVTNFYQGALGRPPNSSELATNSATLNSAADQGQLQVISAAETMGRNLFAAQVNDASLSNTQYVTNLYEGFLQRGPDAGGLGWWSGQASVGQGRQNVLNAFAASIAFRELAGTLYREVYWLVADHLGTPRMVVNKSGNLASVRRHDYLPFGEELFAGVGGRTTVMGYSANDNVRQKFTSKDRDNETGLDYFLARYYSSTQGRFTSVDPENAGADLENPQSWNAYAYTLNNPVTNTDPDGLKVRLCGLERPCTDDATDISDADWKRFFLNDKSIRLDGNKIYKNGEFIGTWERRSFDDFTDFANGVIFGQGRTPGLTQRLEPVEKVVIAGAIIDVGLIAGVTIGLELAGTRVAAGVCFIAGTLVQGDHGGVPIEEIKEGDNLLTYNEVNKRTEYKTVIKTFARHSQEVLAISFQGEAEPVGVTPEHPFYTRMHRARDSLSSNDDGEWRSAEDLRVGDEIKLASGGWTKVLDIEPRKVELTVYNLEAADNHNYFVGQNGLLVHNQCWMEIRQAARKLANDILKAAKEAQRGTGPKSGEGGDPFMQAARELRQLLKENEKNWLPEFKEVVKQKIQEYIRKGQDINHPNR